MSEIKFRYNKHSEFMLYFMIISSVIFGLFLYILVIYYLGIINGPQYAPVYFRNHPQHALYIIFWLIPIFMLLPVWISARFWGSRDEEGCIYLYEDFAVLYYRNQEIKVNKGELSIKSMTPILGWYILYILKISKKKIKLCSSIIEKKEDRNKKINLSLESAMNRLMYYTKTKKGIKQQEYVVSFYDLKIILGITAPEIFDNSPYYVDYNSMIVIPEGSFISCLTCLIRERENPIHVVGDLQIDVFKLNKKELTEFNLRKRPILDIIELDEQVEL